MPSTIDLTYANFDFSDDDVRIGDGSNVNTNPTGWTTVEVTAGGVGLYDADPASGSVDAIATVTGSGGGTSSLTTTSLETFSESATELSFEITVMDLGTIFNNNVVRFFIDLNDNGVADAGETLAGVGIGSAGANINAAGVTYAAGSETTGFNLSAQPTGAQLTHTYTYDLTGVSDADLAAWDGHQIGITFQSNSIIGEYGVVGVAASMVICFASGTKILTDQGEISVEKLKIGDIVVNADGERRQLRWIGSRKIAESELSENDKLRPVKIMKGALGPDMPKRDLIVSRQHRILVSSLICERVTGSTDTLIPAIKLTKMPGIFIDEEIEEVEYFHLLFDQHEVIHADGALAESLFTGPEALKAVSPEAREELSLILPELEKPGFSLKPAACIPSYSQQKEIVRRHMKNDKGLCDMQRRRGTPGLRSAAKREKSVVFANAPTVQSDQVQPR